MVTNAGIIKQIADEKQEILCLIKEKLIDFKRLYPNSSIKVSFNIPENIRNADTIKHEIIEK
jgi:hypothetical protein